MQELTVSGEQAQFISQAHGPLVVVNEQGQLLGHLTPAGSACDTPIKLTASDRAEIKRRMQSPAPGLTTEEVLSYLHSLN